MKKYFLIICIAIFAVVSAKAQDTLLVNSKTTVKGAPYLINYQAIAKDAAGNILANTDIGTTFRIYNSANQVVYAETGPKVKTNASGMLTYKIGTVAGSADKLATIDWAADTYMLDITLRIGATAVWMGRTSIVSVPYAFYANKANVAKTAENVINYTAGEGIAIENNTIKNTKPVQTLSLKGDTLFISGGNFVVIPGISCLQPCNTNDTLKYIWLKTDQTQIDSIHFEIGTSGQKAEITVDWGDGITEKINFENGVYDNKNVRHKYNSIGIYNVKIYGDLNYINSFNKMESNLTSYINNIVDFDFSNATELFEIHIRSTKIQKASFPKKTKIGQLDLIYNSLNNIDLTNNVELSSLELSHNNLNTIDLSNNTKLEHIGLPINKLTSIDISKQTNLKTIRIFKNELTSINFSSNPLLEMISIGSNKINTLDVTNNLLLKNLAIENNLISSLDISNNVDLEFLSIGQTFIKNLNIENNHKITNLNIWNSNLTSSEVDKFLIDMYNSVVAYPRNNGFINVTGNSIPSQAGMNAINELISNYGWEIWYDK